METLLTTSTKTAITTNASSLVHLNGLIGTAIAKETFDNAEEQTAFLQEVQTLLEDGRIPVNCLYITDLLRLSRALSAKRICGIRMAARLINLLDQLSFVPTCASLWKVIYKRLSIDELPTLVFMLNKAHTAELYQFVGNSYLYKMTKEEMLCLKALIELSEVYALVKHKGKYISPSPTEEATLICENRIKEEWDYSFSLS